jgi:hypothetical protein
VTIAIRSLNRNRLIAAMGTVLILAIIAVAGALLSPERTLAQPRSDGLDQTSPDLTPTSPPPSPPPALQLNPPTATPEPGASDASVSVGAAAGSSDLEAVRFRPDIALQRGEVPPSTAAKKPAGEAGPDILRRPEGEVWGPPEAYHAPDIDALLAPLDWTPLLYENFVDFAPPALETPFDPHSGASVWTIYDFSNDGYERSWGANNWTYYPHADDPSDDQSAWPAAAGRDALDPNQNYYPDYLNSWLDYGPVDLSNMSDVFVSFGLWFETELGFDKVYFCASIDGYSYYCDSWSGSSVGWTDQAYWLTSYAGYSQVWIAWVFQSDYSIHYDGPFVDEIEIWGYDTSATPTPTPTPDPAGELLQNGSFETGDLTHWDSTSSGTGSALEGAAEARPSLALGSGGKGDASSLGSVEGTLDVASVEVTDLSAVDGQYSARLWRDGTGDDFLYQTISVPSDVSDVVLNFWFGVTTYETAIRTDWFCVSMSDPNNHGDIWVAWTPPSPPAIGSTSCTPSTAARWMLSGASGQTWSSSCTTGEGMGQARPAGWTTCESTPPAVAGEAISIPTSPTTIRTTLPASRAARRSPARSAT